MGAIQSSINTALGVAALASGLTNKKQVDKAQDKLDKSEEKLAKTTAEKVNTEKDLANIKEENKQLKDEDIKSNMYLGGNTYNASNDLPTAKETNIGNAGDKSVDNNLTNYSSIGSSLADLLKSQQKINPYETEQIMGFHALKILDSRIAAKKAIVERSKRAMIRARKMGGNE